MTRVRRITLAGGVVLVTGDGRRLLIHPVICPTCRRKVTADSRDHEVTEPNLAAGDGEASVLVARCNVQPGGFGV